jgi:hypothetical protein
MTARRLFGLAKKFLVWLAGTVRGLGSPVKALLYRRHAAAAFSDFKARVSKTAVVVANQH